MSYSYISNNCGHGKRTYDCSICNDCGHGHVKNNCSICND